MTTDEAREALLAANGSVDDYFTTKLDALIAAVRAEPSYWERRALEAERRLRLRDQQLADAEAKLAALREAVKGWVPQHSSACAAQDDDADCICGTAAVYAAALAATPAERLTTEQALAMGCDCDRCRDAAATPAEEERT